MAHFIAAHFYQHSKKNFALKLKTISNYIVSNVANAWLFISDFLWCVNSDGFFYQVVIAKKSSHGHFLTHLNVRKKLDRINGFFPFFTWFIC